MARCYQRAPVEFVLVATRTGEDAIESLVDLAAYDLMSVQLIWESGMPDDVASALADSLVDSYHTHGAGAQPRCYAIAHAHVGP